MNGHIGRTKRSGLPHKFTRRFDTPAGAFRGLRLQRTVPGRQSKAVGLAALRRLFCCLIANLSQQLRQRRKSSQRTRSLVSAFWPSGRLVKTSRGGLRSSASLLRRANIVQAQCRSDEGKMRECLREITKLPLRLRIVFFCQ
jgi:hypothetical protein